MRGRPPLAGSRVVAAPPLPQPPPTPTTTIGEGRKGRRGEGRGGEERTGWKEVEKVDRREGEEKKRGGEKWGKI